MRGVLLLLLASCGRFGFDGGSGDGGSSTSLRLSVSAADGVSLATIDVRVAFGSVDPNALTAIATPVPSVTVVPLPDESGALTATIDAVDARGRELTANATTTASAGAQASLSVVIGGDVDAACRNGVIDSGETDIDCGGACPACGMGSACALPSDCVSASCAANTCELASGPPTWLRMATLPLGRIGAGAAAVSDGQIYVYGGATSDALAAVTEVDVYDTVADKWAGAPPLVTAAYRMGSVSGTDGKAYAIGGSPMGRSALTTVETFLPGASQWINAPSLGTANAAMGATLDAAGKIYLLGGDPQGSDTVVFDGASWALRSPLLTPRTNLAAAPTTDGLLLALGGHPVGVTSTHYDTVEAYDPAANGWRTMPPLSVARSDLTAALGPDGRVYAIGGYDGVTTLTIVETFRPGATHWVGVSGLSVGRDTGFSTVARDGRIFVFGGKIDSTTAHADVEAYGPRIALGAPSGSAGATLAITGANFGANASVRVYFDAIPVELGSTNAAGTLAPISLEVPAFAPGVHSVRVVDDRSQYPVSLPFTIE